MIDGSPTTIAGCDELIDRVAICLKDARQAGNRALSIDLEDRLIELEALRNAMIDIPEQRTGGAP